MSVLLSVKLDWCRIFICCYFRWIESDLRNPFHRQLPSFFPDLTYCDVRMESLEPWNHYPTHLCLMGDYHWVLGELWDNWNPRLLGCGETAVTGLFRPSCFSHPKQPQLTHAWIPVAIPTSPRSGPASRRSLPLCFRRRGRYNGT